MDTYTFITLFLTLASLIVGLGAVTVIDLHGLLARTSTYWTEVVIKMHKITKLLIWGGILGLIIFGALFYFHEYALNRVPYTGFAANIPPIQAAIAGILFCNGLFLHFWVSKRLMQLEKEGKANQLIPSSIQTRTIISFIFSFCGWWSEVLLLTFYLLSR